MGTKYDTHRVYLGGDLWLAVCVFPPYQFRAGISQRAYFHPCLSALHIFLRGPQILVAWEEKVAAPGAMIPQTGFRNNYSRCFEKGADVEVLAGGFSVFVFCFGSAPEQSAAAERRVYNVLIEPFMFRKSAEICGMRIIGK